MRAVVIGLICIASSLACSPVMADALGDEDDSYIGLQVTIPFNTNREKLKQGRIEYSLLLMNQNEGVRDGIAFNRDAKGVRTVGYLMPSQTFILGRSNISDYTIPIVSLNKGGARLNAYSSGEMLVGLVVGVAAIVAVAHKFVDEIEDCADPDTESEEIAGC